MYGYIYKTINLINGKFYIGQKKSEKFLNESYLGSGVRLKSAIKHYGEDKFLVELIDTANTQDELNQKEIFWIEVTKATDPTIGYNIAKGGDGGNTGRQYKGMPPHKAKHTVETKKKMSDSRMGHETSDECKRKISEANTGKKRTPEMIEANRERNLGKIWVKKGDQQTTIQPSELDEFLNDGWVCGRLPLTKPVWNKGLTSDTDPRVESYASKRRLVYENGGSIGCFGVKGNQFAKKKD